MVQVIHNLSMRIVTLIVSFFFCTFFLLLNGQWRISFQIKTGILVFQYNEWAKQLSNQSYISIHWSVVSFICIKFYKTNEIIGFAFLFAYSTMDVSFGVRLSVSINNVDNSNIYLNPTVSWYHSLSVHVDLNLLIYLFWFCSIRIDILLFLPHISYIYFNNCIYLSIVCVLFHFISMYLFSCMYCLPVGRRRKWLSTIFSNLLI